MRLEASVKMGYYPTPLSTVERIRSFLKFPRENVSVLDPCCGEGLALKSLVENANATTYGIELDEYRAERAKANLNHVLKGSYEDARISNGVFSCLFLNPPYDWDTPSESSEAPRDRKEKTFLRGTMKYLQPNGTLIYIIPQNRLTDDVSRILSYRFDDFNAFRFQDDEYDKYRQIVLFGVKKERGSMGDAGRLNDLSRETPDEIPFADEPMYELPPSKPVHLFRSSVIDEKELEKLLKNSPLWEKIRNHNDDGSMGRPPLPLHKGHLGLLLANGCLDGIFGEGNDKHIVRGKAEKIISVYDEYDGDALIEREVENYRISIKVLERNGEIKTLM